MKKYNIEINDDLLDIITRALELYTRIGIGDSRIIADELIWEYRDVKDPQYQTDSKLCKHYMKFAFETILKTDGYHLGIYNPKVKDRYNIAYEMMKKIRKCQWDNDEDRPEYSVDGHGTLYKDLNGELDINIKE